MESIHDEGKLSTQFPSCHLGFLLTQRPAVPGPQRWHLESVASVRIGSPAASQLRAADLPWTCNCDVRTGQQSALRRTNLVRSTRLTTSTLKARTRPWMGLSALVTPSPASAPASAPAPGMSSPNGCRPYSVHCPSLMICDRHHLGIKASSACYERYDGEKNEGRYG